MSNSLGRKLWRGFFALCMILGAIGFVGGGIPGWLGAQAEEEAEALSDADVTPTTGRAYLLRVDGPIGPATTDYIRQNLDDAQGRANLVILFMDTPGGLDEATRDINRAILASRVPVATYVGPSGARAASAGTYIIYASHIAAMAPGTNLGAATPVQIGGAEEGDPRRQPAGAGGDDDAEERRERTSQEAMRAKVVSDSVAYIRSLAELRGRNVEWAEKAVREAASLTASEAAEINVIDFVAENVDDLLEKAHGREVKIGDTVVTVRSRGLVVEEREKSWAQEFLSIITNPTIALLLLNLGFLGLLVEFYNPGALFPGVTGLICLIVGLYALNTLPVNYAGAALIVLGLLLLVGEAFITSYGILAIAGLVSFFLGATMLFDTEAPGFQISWPVAAGITAGMGGLMFLVLTYGLAAQARKVVTGAEDLIGMTGRVARWEGREGYVILDGERWRARSDEPLEEGDEIIAKKLDGLVIVVEPKDKKRRK